MFQDEGHIWIWRRDSPQYPLTTYAAYFYLMDPQAMAKRGPSVTTRCGTKIYVLHCGTAKHLVDKDLTQTEKGVIEDYAKEWSLKLLFVRTWEGTAWNFYLSNTIDPSVRADVFEKIKVSI